MDYVTWESLEAAQTAAKAIKPDEAMLPFMQVIENVESFQNLKPL